MQLQGVRAVVTGGGAGLGAAAVQAYVSEGASVALLDVDERSGRSLTERLAADGYHVTFQHCDVALRSAVDAAFDTALDFLGGLHVLIHAAGISGGGSAAEITDQDWDRFLTINAKGTMHTNQAAFRAMQATGGSIVNFGSMAGIRAVGSAGHYAASKGAVMAWTRVAAGEWGRFGIRVNAVAPSASTGMYEAFRARLSPTELHAWDADLARAVPLRGRLGDPDRDIAPVLVFLGSDSARFITGQVISIDGGRVMLGS
jgi:NAD(P)-dependent dehydrogenase (short-subunit alcohol dehydrogenase family)